ncbi:MAG: PTS sugar transporter subunit IIA [Mobilitalea sp.]
MQEKELQVLSYLKSQNSWSTAANIASNLGFSVRSVKTYISNINSKNPELIASSRDGFLIQEKERLSPILNAASRQIPQSADNRQTYILKVLLLQNQTKDLDELAEELCISPATLTNEFPKIKFELTNFDLVFKTKNNCAYIDGLEKNKKKMISHLIYNETKDNFSSIDLIQSYLPDIDLKIIKHVVTDKLLCNHYFIDDFSLTNFVLHVGITMERFLSNPSLNEIRDSVGNVAIAETVARLLREICDSLEKYFPIHFSENDYYNLSLLLMTRIVHENINQLNISQVNEIVGPKISSLMELIQNKVRNVFYINLNNQDFIIRFSLHLYNMLIRLENNINVRNPQLTPIKNTYPYIYDVSVFIANTITTETGYLLSEDEIAYISLHIGVLIEEQKALRDKVKVIIVCPHYYSNHVRLIKKIHTVFEDSILLSGVVTTPDELDNSAEYDCVITTIPLNRHLTIPVTLISDYFDNKDICNIVNVIDEIKKTRVKTVLENKLKFIFKKELFFYNPDNFSNQTDAIEKLSYALVKEGYVDQSFREKLYERERLSSSAYTNIALPHPIDMCSFSTAIAVSIHPNAIDWNGSKVHVVFMLAINEEDRILFRDIFDLVTEILLNKKNFQTLLNTKNYEDFIQLLISSV